MLRILILLIFSISASIFLFLVSIPFGAVFAVLMLVLFIFLIRRHNDFVFLKEIVNQRWADIDAKLQQRINLSIKLVEIVKDYAYHESSTLENVIKARRQFSEASTLQEKVSSANVFENSMVKLIAVSERYPDLKANVSYNKVIDTLTVLEGEIAELRKGYNEAVRVYKVNHKEFPSNIIFMMLGLGEINYFNASENDSISDSSDMEEPIQKESLSERVCFKCGADVSDTAKFCKNCGVKLNGN